VLALNGKEAKKKLKLSIAEKTKIFKILASFNFKTQGFKK
jgi:hypothetical protein